MKAKLALLAGALVASFAAHAGEPAEPTGHALGGFRMKNTQQLNGLSVNGLMLRNGISANGMRLNNGLSVNGLRLDNGIGINGLMLKNSEQLGDTDAPTQLRCSGCVALMPQVVGIVFDGAGASR